jgi:hypothetical protein
MINYILIDSNGGKVPDELNIKVREAIAQYEQDLILDMPSYGFFSDLTLMPEKRNHVPYTPQCGYGTYREQQDRLKSYREQLIRDLIYDPKTTSAKEIVSEFLTNNKNGNKEE